MRFNSGFKWLNYCTSWTVLAAWPLPTARSPFYVQVLNNLPPFPLLGHVNSVNNFSSHLCAIRFRRVRKEVAKATTTSVTPLCPSVRSCLRLQQLDAHGTDLQEIWLWWLLQKCTETLQLCLKWDKYIRHSTGRHTCIDDYFGYYGVIVRLASKIKVSSLSEFIDIAMVFIIVAVTMVRFVAVF